MLVANKIALPSCNLTSRHRYLYVWVGRYVHTHTHTVVFVFILTMFKLFRNLAKQGKEQDASRKGKKIKKFSHEIYF